MPQAEIRTITPPFVVLGFEKPPRSSAEAKALVASRNREAAERRAAEETDHANKLAEIASLCGEVVKHGRINAGRRMPDRTMPTPPAPAPSAAPAPKPAAPSESLEAMWARHSAKPAEAKAPRIDIAAVYEAVNSPRGVCDECGGAKHQPSHGVVSDNIKPTAPRARSLSQVAAEVYGFAAGGVGDGLINSTPRGGGR